MDGVIRAAIAKQAMPLRQSMEKVYAAFGVVGLIDMIRERTTEIDQLQHDLGIARGEIAS